MHTSRIPGFYNMSVDERRQVLTKISKLTDMDIEQIFSETLPIETADKMIENVVGTFPLPLGLGLNFLINDKEYIVPMAVEEPSVVASASYIAKLVREAGGFKTEATDRVMIGQIQVVGCEDFTQAKQKILEEKETLIEQANAAYPSIVARGGGTIDLDVRILNEDANSQYQQMLVLHFYINTCDAMGANIINTIMESLAPTIERITGGKVYLRILTNLATDRLVRASVKVKKEELGGEDVVDKIVSAEDFALADPYRATTHNKGIMNGITAAVMATGNDTRAIESGAHAYAAITGQYLPLTTWEKDSNGDLVGTIEMPMAVGLVGGATKVHPQAQVAVSILGVESADELGEVYAALGLAQNLSAIRALATEGIQRGHMSLHAKNLATQAGAKGDQIEKVVKEMIAAKKINLEYAKEVLKNI